MAQDLLDNENTAEAPLVAAVRAIEKAIAAANDHLTFETDPVALGDSVLGLVRSTAALDGLRSQLVTQAAANGVAKLAGVRTMGQFVGSHTNSSPVVTRRDELLGRWVRDYPIFAEAFYSGQISTEHVQVLRRLETRRSIGLLRSAQQLLVDAAVGVKTFKAFERACEYWLVTVDPDGEEPLDQVDSNSVRFQRGSGGRGKMTLDLDAISYAAAKKMINHRADKLRVAQGAIDAPNAVGHDRFSALMSLMVDGFARADGTLPVPIINVVMSQKVAEWAHNQVMGAPPAAAVPVDADDPDARCELIDGTPVHPLLVAAMCGLWRFRPPVMRRYVMTAKSRIVDYSYNARIHPEHLRTASLIEHRGLCAMPGCDAPHHWLQMDHVDPHSKGGPTSLPNTKPYCAPDNRAKGDRRMFAPSHRPWKPRGGRGYGDDSATFTLRI